MVEKKENTHIVLKIEDAQKYLDLDSIFQLQEIVDAVNKGRLKDGKKEASYYVCNIDEPYAQEVLDTILKGEENKNN